MEIIELMEREPELNEINKHIEQKKVQWIWSVLM
jgi:hypothetical protein